ncbi:glycosyltransferase family 2 protein [Patescibacteria group bacterium]
MKRQPLVSVVITTKNEANNIFRILHSIKNQSYRSIEIVVVDNNSTDDTVKMAKEFSSKVYNYGPERSAQRNYGAAKSKGKYLLFLDADMELTRDVVKSAVETSERTDKRILTIAETTVGKSFMAKIRKFEREMYMGEPDYEVPRFFEKSIFLKYGGYDEKLTGPEDYDLPYRMRNSCKICRIKRHIYHHENDLTLKKLLTKKYYYAKKGAYYAIKHPKLIRVQGTILFRKVYLKNWREFIKHPFLGISFVFVRFLETCWAVAGFISAVGFRGFIKTFYSIFLN